MVKQDSASLENTHNEKLTYEQAYSELEKIVKSLESEDHSLDQALVLFERGQALIQFCADLVDQAELKIQQIVGDNISDFPIDQN